LPETLTVPKVASQVGAPRLYEALRDIVRNASRRANEIEASTTALADTLAASISGTSGALAKFTSGTTISDSVVVEAAGFIGVDEPSPVGKLHVTDDGGSALAVYDMYGSDVLLLGRAANGTKASPTAVLS